MKNDVIESVNEPEREAVWMRDPLRELEDDTSSVSVTVTVTLMVGVKLLDHRGEKELLIVPLAAPPEDDMLPVNEAVSDCVSLCVR